MILQALTAYYEQLLKQGKVEAPGWDSRFKVSYELRLGPDGQLLALNDLRQEVPKGKKTVIAPRELPVPHRVKRASGVAANFLCDNTSYLLGADEKGKPSAPASASRPVPPSTTRCSTVWTPLPPKPSSPFLTAGSRIQPPPTRCWQSSGPT